MHCKNLVVPNTCLAKNHWSIIANISSNPKLKVHVWSTIYSAWQELTFLLLTQTSLVSFTWNWTNKNLREKLLLNIIDDKYSYKTVKWSCNTKAVHLWDQHWISGEPGRYEWVQWCRSWGWLAPSTNPPATSYQPGTLSTPLTHIGHYTK